MWIPYFQVTIKIQKFSSLDGLKEVPNEKPLLLSELIDSESLMNQSGVDSDVWRSKGKEGKTSSQQEKKRENKAPLAPEMPSSTVHYYSDNSWM